MKIFNEVVQKIKELLNANDKKLEQIEGLVVFKGPGSFTGLRIGISVANALADSLKIPIVGSTGSDWVMDAIASLKNGGTNDQLVLPEYGAPPHVTTPKK